jgi:hypothetical protein
LPSVLAEFAIKWDYKEKIYSVCLLSSVTIQMISVFQWSEFLTTDLEVPGSILGAARFSDKWYVWNGVHSD